MGEPPGFAMGRVMTTSLLTTLFYHFALPAPLSSTIFPSFSHSFCSHHSHIYGVGERCEHPQLGLASWIWCTSDAKRTHCVEPWINAGKQSHFSLILQTWYWLLCYPDHRDMSQMIDLTKLCSCFGVFTLIILQKNISDIKCFLVLESVCYENGKLYSVVTAAVKCINFYLTTMCPCLYALEVSMWNSYRQTVTRQSFLCELFLCAVVKQYFIRNWTVSAKVLSKTLYMFWFGFFLVVN